MATPTRRFVYIVMIWEERPASPGSPAVWRTSVEDAHTGERWGFACLEQAAAFLRHRRDDDARSPSQQNHSRTQKGDNHAETL